MQGRDQANVRLLIIGLDFFAAELRLGVDFRADFVKLPRLLFHPGSQHFVL